ncbi:gamma-glutamylputrescine oxidase [Roseovarius litoreus]|uniref:Gamma-glutamylputrescine oxidase n=1 Tax=Roseovarius litoreus TaxID=1155722 RepID=A0A1M7F5Y0_9RHOB|nr:FAD-binding oxidoreductase [Roseovarius litoreus]SHL99452.1 gamma-glutamylputrescine oxidase [Roseovarius litoreus]
MNLLFANDRQGQYPPSWYAATATPLAPFDPLRGQLKADVCIIGAGYTGLSAALHLAEAGLNVVLLEAHRVGFGASGRNGGQLGSGQRMEQTALERLVGKDDAAKLWDLAEDAKTLVKSLISRHGIDCHLKPGIAHMCFSAREVAEEHAYADHLAAQYGYTALQKLDREAAQALCPSPRYMGGTLDMTAAHLHPLGYALGLARAAQAAGVRIHENTLVSQIDKGTPARVQTNRGAVTADHVILACNGYLGGLDARVAARVMPINNFIAATEPLGPDAARVLTRDIAVADTKFVVNYFRLSHDNRLLFGGGESYGYRFPDIDATVRKPMSEIFPHLRDIRFEYTWGGTLAITMRRMPYLARLAPNILSASGYSGHGVGTATHAGKLMADAIAGQSAGFDTLCRVPAPRFPGGSALRAPLLALAMTWYATRDRLGI